MQNKNNKLLQYDYELLRARHEIMRHSLKLIIREVYENVGQVLSLVRVQLTMLEQDDRRLEKTKLAEPGNLIGQVICDLRNLCRNVLNESEIPDYDDLTKTLKNQIGHYQQNAEVVIETNEVPASMKPGDWLIFLSIMLNIFEMLRSQQNEIIYIQLKSVRNKIDFRVDYKDDRQRGEEKNALCQLDLFERIKSIGGLTNIKRSAKGISRIKLLIPS